jgi:hypothetical protein
VHEIIYDDINEDSMEKNMDKLAAGAEQTAEFLKENDGRGKVGIGGKFVEVSHRRPQVMKFCPSLSTREVDISLSGKSYFLLFLY